ncbi:hypothetical protein BGZ96_006693 [Linnemannia gamsii]|uniref:Uncharacterized protein n=1 Tax=Linnemannia gamsii TaxID=64522 RepID=A0ABQ7K203_9FUNG|nr:hypothetical protein BGZ96_006693 [Linnemannia gamsii]
MFGYHLIWDPKVGQYNVDQNAWVASGMEFPAYDVQGIFAATDPTTGYIYITGGYTKYDQGRLAFVDKYHPSRPTESVTFIPFPAEGFLARRYIANVFCKPRGGILYFGGYDDLSNPITEANTTTVQN